MKEKTKKFMDKKNFFIKTQIESDLSRVVSLIESGVFNAKVLGAFKESVFTEIIIRLNDLLQRLNQSGHRIDFTDDVKNAKDITDLVNKIRNAVCHMSSGEHLLDKDKKIKFTFNIAYGKCSVISVDGKKTTSDYEDDICFFFGNKKIYFKRHIIRCVQEVREQVDKIYAE